MESIFTGIVSGLLVAIILVIFQKIWVASLVPWYEEKIYKDAEIEGEWGGRYRGTKIKDNVTLKRSGHAVSGVIVIVEGADQGKTFEFAGTFKNLILTVNYSSLNRRSLDRGSYTLTLRHNGEKFEGFCNIYEDTSGKIISVPCVWTRKGN